MKTDNSLLGTLMDKDQSKRVISGYLTLDYIIIIGEINQLRFEKSGPKDGEYHKQLLTI